MLLQKPEKFPRLPGRMILELAIKIVKDTSGSVNDDSGYSLFETCMRAIVLDGATATFMNKGDNEKWRKNAVDTLCKMNNEECQLDLKDISMENIFEI